MASDITSIRWASGLGNTPARSNRATGEVWKNIAYKNKLNANEWAFIIEHERAHIQKQTTNEFLADAVARTKYLKSGRSLRDGIRVMTDFFSNGNPEQKKRTALQIKEFLQYDCTNNGHQPACEALKETQMHPLIPHVAAAATSYILSNSFTGHSAYSDFTAYDARNQSDKLAIDAANEEKTLELKQQEIAVAAATAGVSLSANGVISQNQPTVASNTNGFNPMVLAALVAFAVLVYFLLIKD